MARFNPDDYETVAERIKRFLGDHENGRITTELLQVLTPETRPRWVVQAYLWLGDVLVSTGLAEEQLGGAMANADAALENAETSAIGRALANWRYSGDKRPSREEMGKADRNAERRKAAAGKPDQPKVAKQVPDEVTDLIAGATTHEELKALWSEHMRKPWAPALSDAIKNRIQQINDENTKEQQ